MSTERLSGRVGRVQVGTQANDNAVADAQARLDAAAHAAQAAQVRWVASIERWRVALEACLARGAYPAAAPLERAQVDAAWADSVELREKYREASERFVQARVSSPGA